jgi:hypothetical protein
MPSRSDKGSRLRSPSRSFDIEDRFPSTIPVIEALERLIDQDTLAGTLDANLTFGSLKIAAEPNGHISPAGWSAEKNRCLQKKSRSPGNLLQLLSITPRTTDRSAVCRRSR